MWRFISRTPFTKLIEMALIQVIHQFREHLGLLPCLERSRSSPPCFQFRQRLHTPGHAR